MKSSSIKYGLVSATLIAVAVFSLALPAFAQTTSTTRAANRQAALQQRMQNLQGRGGKEIQNRIDALNKLLTRIQSMKNLSDSEKAAFSSTLQTSITSMTALESKIQSDTSTTTLRADLQTIAPDYRIYMLVMPQLSILSAVDRVNTLVTTLQTTESKIQTRVSADASLSSNTTISSDISDMTAKLSDASSQASAAQTEIVGLAPDQGNTTVMQSNTAALKDARSKIQTATKDLQSARADAGAIIKIIIGTFSAAIPASSSSAASQ